ncbi:MAG: IS66 family transposase [Myxococcales bacterium]|nr:IS66 family transposase [Myxococcales bacterium]
MVDPRDKRIADLEALVLRQAEIIARLERRVAELEAKLGENSTNSHKPPSSDPPGTRPEKRPTGRQRGAQPGHKPHKRVLLPPEKVTRRTEVRPSTCGCCGGRRLRNLEGAPRLHQVVDVPEIHPDVHEIRMHGAECHDCGETTWASLPKGVPAHMFGPRLLAFIGYFLAARTSRRQLREVLEELFGIPVSLGALSEAEARVSEAIAGPVDEAIAHVRGQPVKHVDASTWRREGAYAALWTIATRFVVVFFVAADARSPTIAALLGKLTGIMVTDRGSQFGFWAMDRRQICWAHLIRKFVAFSERKDEGARLGNGLLLLAHAMLSAWHQVRDGTRSRKSYQLMARNAQQAFEKLLERGVELRLRGVSGACDDILAHKAALFTFAFEAGVEPTNNHAERALRPFVLWRKVSYGSQSERGCLFAERIMTVAHSLRLQKRSILKFLVDACHAHRRRLLPPSLIPSTR